MHYYGIWYQAQTSHANYTIYQDNKEGKNIKIIIFSLTELALKLIQSTLPNVCIEEIYMLKKVSPPR